MPIGNSIQRMGAFWKRELEELGASSLFWWQTMRVTFTKDVEWRTFLYQFHNVTIYSLPTTCVAGIFVGAIMGIQFYMQLKDFGAVSVLGGLTTSGTIREVGPVLIAFMLSGKVGAYTSAELGTMRVTEQIDAIRCLGTDPIRFIIAPRYIAVVIASFLLLTFGLMISMLGGILITQQISSMNTFQYISMVPTYVSWWSVGNGVFKSFVFGGLIAQICCFKGYTTTGGARGVGRTVKETAVRIMIAIIIFDYLTTELADNMYKMLRDGGILQ